MEKSVNVLDLFSGIGGFSLGLMQGGYKINKHYFSEIDKYSEACYRYHFPEAIALGDILNFNTSSINEKIDIITFGSPCQDFSLAGKRKGLEGNRSSLIREAMRIVRELQPSIFIWENVKGAFSSNAREDFWAIIQAFTNLGNYRLEWQLLNTRWFLPQNRERIYLIGHLAGASEPGVFPIGENDKLFARAEESCKRQFQTRYCTTINPKFGNRASDTFIKVPKIAGCLTGVWNSGGLHSDMTTIKVGTFRTHKDGQGFRKVKSNICPTIPARARQDGSGQPVIGAFRGRNPDNPSNRNSGILLEQRLEINEKNVSNTLSSVQKDNVVIEHNCIRRLTEIECERLQGFPDDWTKYGNFDGVVKEISKTQRYKMLGNAVTVSVVGEITKRLLNIIK